MMLTAADDHTHPSDGDEKWQESWASIWYDPVAKVAVYTHTGLQLGRNRADCWLWVAVDGELVEVFNDHTLPLPESDYTDVQVGPVHVRSITPNVERQITLGGKRVKGSFTYKAFTPEALTVEDEGGSYSSEISSGGHYETMGRFQGELEIDGRQIKVNGLGYDDRSWGRRSWDSLHYRITWANFGPDFYAIAYHVATDAGGSTFGWVSRRGVISRVVAADTALVVNPDCLTGRSADVSLWLEDGTGIEYRVEVRANAVINQRDGFLASPGLGIARYGPQLGVGFLEFAEMKHATADVIERYALDMRP